MRKVLLLIVLSGLCGPTAIAQGGDGRVDAGFGDEGELALQRVGYSYPSPVLLDDGRIVLLEGRRVRVLLASGDPDTSVGEEGAIPVSEPPEGDCSIGALIRDDLGRLVGVGRCTFPDEPQRSEYPQNHPGKLLVERWTPAGDLDPSFGGGDGMVVSDLGLPAPGADLLPAPAAQSAIFDARGRIVITGRRESGYEPAYKSLGFQLSSEPFIARLTPDGQVDRSFGKAGAIAVSGLGGNNSLAAQADGGVLLSYVDGYDTSLMRIAAGGEIDADYGESGFRRLARGEALRRFPFGLLGIDPQGRAVFSARVSGLKDHHVKNGVAFKRLLPDGSLDRTLGHSGLATSRLRRMLYSAEALDEKGRVLVAIAIRPRNPGDLRTSEISGISLARLRPDGRLDRSFGQGGVLKILSSPERQDYLNGIQVAGDVALIEEDRCDSGRGCRSVLIRVDLSS